MQTNIYGPETGSEQKIDGWPNKLPYGGVEAVLFGGYSDQNLLIAYFVA